MKRLSITALAAVAAMLTLAFLYFVWPSHYTYAPFRDSGFIRERTDIFTGKTNLQVLDLSSGNWYNH